MDVAQQEKEDRRRLSLERRKKLQSIRVVAIKKVSRAELVAKIRPRLTCPTP